MQTLKKQNCKYQAQLQKDDLQPHRYTVGFDNVKKKLGGAILMLWDLQLVGSKEEVFEECVYDAF